MLLFNVQKNHYPENLYDEIPPVRGLSCSLRSPRQYAGPAVSKTTSFSNIYFQNVPIEGNLLEGKVGHSRTLNEFKRKLLATIRTDKKSTFAVSDTHCARCITKLRVRFSPLRHKFQHSFDGLICKSSFFLKYAYRKGLSYFWIKLIQFKQGVWVKARSELFCSCSYLPY